MSDSTSDIGMMYRDELQRRGVPLTVQNMNALVAQSRRIPGMIPGLSVQSEEPTSGAARASGQPMRSSLPIPPIPPGEGAPSTELPTPPIPPAQGAPTPSTPSSSTPSVGSGINTARGNLLQQAVDNAPPAPFTPPNSGNNAIPAVNDAQRIAGWIGRNLPSILSDTRGTGSYIDPETSTMLSDVPDMPTPSVMRPPNPPQPVQPPSATSAPGREANAAAWVNAATGEGGGDDGIGSGGVLGTAALLGAGGAAPFIAKAIQHGQQVAALRNSVRPVANAPTPTPPPATRASVPSGQTQQGNVLNGMRQTTTVGSPVTAGSEITPEFAPSRAPLIPIQQGAPPPATVGAMVNAGASPDTSTPTPGPTPAAASEAVDPYVKAEGATAPAASSRIDRFTMAEGQAYQKAVIDAQRRGFSGSEAAQYGSNAVAALRARAARVPRLRIP